MTGEETPVAELPPADLLRHLDRLHLEGCRCKWQLKPRTGWVRLDTTRRCPHHDPAYRREHLEETIKQLVPQGQVYAGDDAGRVLALIRDLVWGPT